MGSKSILIIAIGLAAILTGGAIAKAPQKEAAAPKLTNTLVAWISSQAELIVEELEAIVQKSGTTNAFSLTGYLRYLKLYDELKVIADKKIPELKWVSRKANAFSKVYDSLVSIVTDYLREIDAGLRNLEAAEPKSKQAIVGKEWLNHYLTIVYIATHAPKDSKLKAEATELLQYSPSGTPDKVRSARYRLSTNAFSR